MHLKSAKFNKSVGYIVTTVFSLCFLCAIYFFIYLPNKEKNIEEQRFRTLQNIDRNIHEKIDNSVSLLNNIISAEHTDRNYIDDFPKEKFILSVPKIDISIHESELSDNLDSAVTIKVDDAISQVSIALQKKNLSNQLTVNSGSLKFTFKQFIENLLPEAVFDEYIIFSKGKTVFESFPSGISVLRGDSLIKADSGLNASFIKNISTGGKDYKFFLHEVNLGNNTRWILGGLLSNKRYNKERAQLPAGIIMLLIIVVLGMIVIFPWIKLYQMGSKDRLTLADGASIILVSMILMSLMFLCMFKYNSYIRNSSSPDSKRTLAAQITAAFNNEIKRRYDFLLEYDLLRMRYSINGNIVNLNKKGITYVINSSDTERKEPGLSVNILKESINSFKDAADIKQLFWLDSTGQEKYNWTEDATNAPHSNFSSRNYFKRIREGKAYYLGGDNAKEYYLDQVVSRTTGVFTSVISLKSKDSYNVNVAALAFNMSSVDNTLLPAGYSFAIIDNNGKVLYHSVKSRNLNENVKAEFSDSASITSSISSRIENEFISDYYSKTYSLLVTPIRNLPYCIIIFSDKSYQETRDIEVYSFTFTMLLLHFLYIVLQLGITFLACSRRSFFKKQSFDTSWIGPKDYRHKDYLLSSALNVLIIVMLITLFPQTTFLQFLLLLVFTIIFISLFFNRLLARRYLKVNKVINHRYKMYAVKALVAVLIAHNAIAFYLLEDKALLFLAELIAIGLSMLVIKYADILSGYIAKILPAKWNYTHSFSLMAISTLIITSGMPVAFFYISGYNYEQNLSIRYKQTDYANRLLERSKINFTSNDTVPSYNTTGLYFDKAYITEYPAVIAGTGIPKNEPNTIEKNTSLHLLGAFRLLINDKALETAKLFVGGAADGSVMYHPAFFDSQADSGIYTYRETGVKEKYLQLRSYKLNYKIPNLISPKNFFYYWIWLFAALIIFYFIILNIVRKVFCLNLPNLKIWEELDAKIITDNKLNELLFVIGLPGAGKKQTLLNEIREGRVNCGGHVLIYNKEFPETNNVLLADLINIPDKGSEIGKDIEWIDFTEETIKSKYKVIIFNHFEYNIQDDFTNLAKLNMLEQVMLKNSNCKIIILSTIHPVNFLDSLNERGNNGDASVKSGHDLERWHVLLGHYRIAIMPVTKLERSEHAPSNQLLCAETNYTHFLNKMQNVTLEIARDIKEGRGEAKTDELALKLQITAHYFYMYIWQSLTREEKFLLYDLAEDNLVNSYDDYNLTMLLAKGVIINSNGPLQLFNRGFRNFILTAIGNTEAMKIKDRIRENGNWTNLRTPLIIVIVAILGFLLISQQEAYSKLLTYVAALSAGVPIILKIFSLFDKNTTKQV